MVEGRKSDSVIFILHLISLQQSTARLNTSTELQVIIKSSAVDGLEREIAFLLELRTTRLN